MRFSYLLSGWFAVFFLFASTCTGRAFAGEGAGRPAIASTAKRSDVASRSLPRAMLPETRQAAGPAGGQTVSVNPQPLLWPPAGSKEVRYRVRLSQDSRFPEATTTHAESLRWAMFNPHAKLADGRWYWQYGTVRRAGDEAVWSEVFRFEVDPSAAVFATPPAEKMLAACPGSHPRVLISQAELEGFRKRLAGTSAAADYVSHAQRYLGQPLPDSNLSSEVKSSALQQMQR